MKFKQVEKKISITITENELIEYKNALLVALEFYNEKTLKPTPVKDSKEVLYTLLNDFSNILSEVNDN